MTSFKYVCVAVLLLSLHLCVADAFIDVMSLLKAGFGATFSLRHLSFQSKLVDHFFAGLDEVKQCIDPSSSGGPSLPTTPSWFELIKARFFPEYADAMHAHWFEASVDDDTKRRRRRWAGCIVGPVRSAGAAYLIASEAILPLIPAVPWKHLKQLPKRASKVLGPLRKRLASKAANANYLKWY